MKFKLLSFFLIIIVSATTLFAQQSDNSNSAEQSSKNSPYYCGITLNYGFTGAAGSFESQNRVWKDHGTSYGAALYAGYMLSASHSLDLNFSYAREQLPATREYSTYSARSEFIVHSFDCALLYRYNYQNYFFSAGPAVFKPSINETVYLPNSSKSADVTAKSIVPGVMMRIGESFKISEHTLLTVSLFAKVPVYYYTTENDSFMIYTTGISFGSEYRF